MKLSELLTDESKWTKHSMFRNRDGLTTTAEHAVSFCLIGAMVKCGLNTLPNYLHIDYIIRELYNYTDTASFNDCLYTTFKRIRHVISVFEGDSLCDLPKNLPVLNAHLEQPQSVAG